MFRQAASQAACGLALFLSATWCAAGSFAVSPVRATLSPNQPVVSLTVHNSGAASAVIQLETVAWTQAGGTDVYKPTREILATPPIFTVPAGGSQVVRVGVRRASQPGRELTYRLFLQEVPPPPKPGFQGLNVALRVGVPVFVVPAEPVAPKLDWRAYRTPQGELVLSAANNGNAHVQVANFTLTQTGQLPGKYELAAYVLPGEHREWLLKKVKLPGPRLQLTAQTDAGPQRAEVVVEKR